MEALYQTSLAALKEVVREMTAFLPNLIAACVMLAGGWAFSKIVEKVVNRLLRTLRTNEAAERMGITGLFRHLGMQRSPVDIIRWPCLSCRPWKRDGWFMFRSWLYDW
jgi:hypothetical protein